MSFNVKLSERLHRKLKNTTAFIRYGRISVPLGLLEVTANRCMTAYGDIYLVYHTKLKEIATEDIVAAGYADRNTMLELLRSKYNNATRETEMTVFRFRLKNEENSQTNCESPEVQ
jgi:hypothetical protein